MKNTEKENEGMNIVMENKIAQLMKTRPDLRDKLYCRGFLLTNAVIRESEYPYLTNWRKLTCGCGKLLIHPKQHVYLCEGKQAEFLLIGHAYNPFTMESDETTILRALDDALGNGMKAYFDVVNQLTGVFTLIWIQGETVSFTGDASGMQTNFYTKQGDTYYISSHIALLGELLGLAWDKYIEQLTAYRFFPLLGNSLPGDLTPYAEVKRAIPNHYVTISPNGVKAVRFYCPKIRRLSVEELAEQASDLLHRNLQLISQKWKRPAISMTGGCDSKTTLACAAGLYDKFTYFSYVSSEEERVDAEAAHEICKTLGLQHTTYHIPEKDDEIPDVENVRTILYQNTGCIRPNNPNDVRKRAFFADTEDFDVEVKSWASEIGRAYYSKRFHGRKKFGSDPTPRACTTLYKFFLHDRKLVRKTDEVFHQYLAQYFESNPENAVPWQEQFFWEFRVASWNGMVITGEHRYSFDITIPYNNRLLLELLLSAPIDTRINDGLYAKIRALRNPAIDATHIAVTNLKHTKKREIAENIYYTIHSVLPF